MSFKLKKCVIMIIDNERYIRNLVGHIPMLRPVVTLIIYKDNKILLQKRNDNGTWAIHGGGMNVGETYLETLNRELKEELGIIPINPILMGIFSGEKLHHIYSQSKDEVYVLNHVFFCEDYEGEINFSDGEVEKLKWFNINDLPTNIFEINKPIINNIKKFVETKQVIID